MNVSGLIFSNIHDREIPEMTRMRTMASIPFGCRYRLIDFALSNFVNSDITTVGIITHNNYASLMDHVGTGKDWDLARRSGGIKILPPFVSAYENRMAGKLYETRLEALMGSVSFIDRCGSDYIVMSDCDTILNVDLADVLRDHVSSGAFLTVVTKRVNATKEAFQRDVNVFNIDRENRITDLSIFRPQRGNIDVSTNIFVIGRNDLLNIVSDSIAHGYSSFYRDVIAKQLKKRVIRAYRFEGYCRAVSSLESYFKNSMALLKEDVRGDLFGNPNRKIFTKVRNSPPTRYSENARARNCLIADGCTIDGIVENCILFRGVHVGKNTVIRNSILLQDTYVGDGALLNCVIADKNVVIKDGRHLSGHETMPFFIEKGKTV